MTLAELIQNRDDGEKVTLLNKKKFLFYSKLFYIFVLVKQNTYIMYKKVKEYYQFLKELEKQRDEFLSKTKESVLQQMDVFMSEHGWTRKNGGKDRKFTQKVFYTKKFNGKDIVIEYRCNYQDDLSNGGLPEFSHDKSIPTSIEKLQMGYFHWNDQDTSGWSLDVVMERMEVFYNNYTL